MGILSSSVSISTYEILGTPPAGEPEEWGGERLRKGGFLVLGEAVKPEVMGFVTLEDFVDASFDIGAQYWRTPYLCYSLRIDTRRVPPMLMAYHYQRRIRQWLDEHPQFKGVPRSRREELKELTRMDLMAKTLPYPTVVDVVCDLEQNLAFVGTLNDKLLGAVEASFKERFSGLSLVSLHPYARAARLLGPQRLPLLAAANKARSDQVLDLIQHNRWLGRDFMLWLLYGAVVRGGDYRVRTSGPAVDGEAFTAYLDQRLVLSSEGGETVQNISVSGPQSNYEEVRSALRAEKQLEQAMLFMEKDELSFRLTLKGDHFRFSSVKTPTIDRDREAESAGLWEERLGRFYERMLLVQMAFQLFDSLYLSFLEARLDPTSWNDQLREINRWLAA